MKKLSKTASTIIWAFAYFGLLVAVVISGCIAFHRYYYCSVFVSGTSMEPTLMGGGFTGESGIAHYGIIDVTDHALKGIKRFDIITTYYPWDDKDYIREKDPETGAYYYKPGHTKPDGYDPDRKIKRVIAMPGETIKIINGDIIIGKIPDVITDIQYNTDYKFGVLPNDYRDNYMKFFRAADSNSMFYAYSYDDAYDVYFDETGREGEYYFRYKLRAQDGDPIEYKYINIHRTCEEVDGHYVEGVQITYDMTPETIWTYSSKYKTIKTYVTGFKDENKNLEGDYIFTTVKDEVEATLQITQASLVNSLKVSPVQVIKRNFNDIVVYSRELVKGNTSYENYEILKNYKTNYQIPFARKFDQFDYSVKDTRTKFGISEVAIMDERYWVQGDHWSSSTDCADSNHGPIYYENIEGVLVAIEGTCEIRTNPETKKKECINHKRMIPKLL